MVCKTMYAAPGKGIISGIPREDRTGKRMPVRKTMYTAAVYKGTWVTLYMRISFFLYDSGKLYFPEGYLIFRTVLYLVTAICGYLRNKP